MGKARTDKNGHTREQRLLHENQRLKKQISSLRKQLARLDLDRLSTVRDIIEEHTQLEKEASAKKVVENIEKQWACNSCGSGIMEIFVYNRTDTTYYYRVCSNAPNCSNRTLPKIYDVLQVKGVYRK